MGKRSRKPASKPAAPPQEQHNPDDFRLSQDAAVVFCDTFGALVKWLETRNNNRLIALPAREEDMLDGMADGYVYCMPSPNFRKGVKMLFGCLMCNFINLRLAEDFRAHSIVLSSVVETHSCAKCKSRHKFIRECQMSHPNVDYQCVQQGISEATDEAAKRVERKQAKTAGTTTAPNNDELNVKPPASRKRKKTPTVSQTRCLHVVWIISNIFFL